MRAARRVAVLGGLAVACVLPTSALATSVVHLYVSQQQSVATDTGFRASGEVSWGTGASHGPVVGTWMLDCITLFEPVPKCEGSIVIGDSSVSIKEEMSAPNNPTFVTGGTGMWAGAHGVIRAHKVSDSASNFELVLSSP